MKQIDSDLIPFLINLRFQGNNATIHQQLDRQTYTRLNKILELAGGKWNRSAKAHVFPDDAESVIADAIATGEILDRKKELQYFPTPDAIADKLVDLAGLNGSEPILEPSAGDGSIIRAVRRRYKLNNIVAVEIDNKHREKLLEVADDVYTSDFLTLSLPHFDRIIANPPFRNLQDIQHVMRMYELLEPGGRLVSITSPSWQFRTTKLCNEFRALLGGADHEVIELPEGAFKESGTNIRTLVLVINKEA